MYKIIIERVKGRMEVKRLERIFKKSMVISLLRKFPIPILRNLFKRILIILLGLPIGSL